MSTSIEKHQCSISERIVKLFFSLPTGPGSGKTRSAAAYALLAMARARQQGTDKNVLAITFTNNATEEFAKRVKENAAEVGLDKQPHVSTIHGLCAGILG